MTRSVYVAGPMRGYDNFNFPAFDSACVRLRTAGWTAFSPAENDRANGFDENHNSLSGFDLAAAFRWDVDRIFEADAIYMLTGWEASTGARCEHSLAQVLGKQIMYEATELVPA